MEIKEANTKLDGFTVDLTDQETALDTLSQTRRLRYCWASSNVKRGQSKFSNRLI